MIFLNENQQAPAPEVLSFNITMIGPVLIQFGTQAQQQRFLARAAHLDDWWCQGFSEPGAGSDLASLKTAAKRVNGHYVVNGQKIWTSTAHQADWCFVLVRTNPNAAKQLAILTCGQVQPATARRGREGSRSVPHVGELRHGREAHRFVEAGDGCHEERYLCIRVAPPQSMF